MGNRFIGCIKFAEDFTLHLKESKPTMLLVTAGFAYAERDCSSGFKPLAPGVLLHGTESCAGSRTDF